MTDAMLLGLTLAFSSAFSVLGALLIFAGLRARATPPIFSPEIEDQDAVFVFRNSVLVDASDRGRRLLQGLAGRDAEEFVALSNFLLPHFPDLHRHLADVVAAGRLELTAQDASRLALTLQFRAGLVHLRLVDPTVEGALLAMDRLSFQAMQDELQTLRHVARTAPVVAWQQDAQGRIVWANDAYIRMLSARAQGAPALTWPLPELFERSADQGRLILDLPDGPRWFAHTAEEGEGMVTHFATPIDSAVQSELARRDMLQMLTRTFASLPIGLALFDAERRLQVFNPALVDLTGLDPFFLAARPDLAQVLHTLRELRMLPEPKDFTTWRDEMLRMESAAVTGTYHEEWILAGGVTYQVTGCPQPNGAVAFFIQDVTSEATLLRGFRAEMAQTDAVLDAIPDAVVAFDRSGQVILANAAYTRLWDIDPTAGLSDRGIHHAQSVWSRACDNGPALGRLQAYLSDATQTQVFVASTGLRDGSPLAIQAQNMPTGGSLVMFRPLQSDQAATPRPIVLGQLDHHLRAPDLAAFPTGLAAKVVLDAADTPLRPKAKGVRHAGTRLRM